MLVFGSLNFVMIMWEICMHTRWTVSEAGALSSHNTCILDLHSPSALFWITKNTRKTLFIQTSNTNFAQCKGISCSECNNQNAFDVHAHFEVLSFSSFHLARGHIFFISWGHCIRRDKRREWPLLPGGMEKQVVSWILMSKISIAYDSL